jgi:formiminotetrahydrofolate cyclodeaminase
MLINKAVIEFVDELASDSPAPGGGSTAALVGALSAALCVMVMNLTQGEKFKDVAAAVQGYNTRAVELKDRLVNYVDEDTNVFNKVIAAYKLPKSTEEEKISRSATVQQAMKEAASLPLTVAEACLAVLELAAQIIKIGNSNAASDAAVAGVTAFAAVQGALYNVKINLLFIKDDVYVKDMKAKIAAITAEAEQANREIISLAQQAIM